MLRGWGLCCCAGAQWEKAAEVFEEMQNQGCTPDVVTFTALISAYEKGGQWERALGAYEHMRAQRCKPDSIVFNAIIDTLWETGVIWAQRKACPMTPPVTVSTVPAKPCALSCCPWSMHRAQQAFVKCNCLSAW
jgi:pentatricopeptide repeat protein